MCREAGIGGHKTNHSLHVTAAEVQHKAMSSLLSNTPDNSRSMSYDQHLTCIKNRSFNMSSTSYAAPPIPSINLHNLYGCTINFNYAPATIPTQPAVVQDTGAIYTEAELEVFSQADMFS